MSVYVRQANENKKFLELKKIELFMFVFSLWQGFFNFDWSQIIYTQRKSDSIGLRWGPRIFF